MCVYSPGWLPTASVCRSMWCDVCVEKNGKMKNRDSLARKSVGACLYWRMSVWLVISRSLCVNLFLKKANNVKRHVSLLVCCVSMSVSLPVGLSVCMPDGLYMVVCLSGSLPVRQSATCVSVRLLLCVFCRQGLGNTHGFTVSEARRPKSMVRSL